MKKYLLLIITGFILLSFSSCRNESSSVIGGAMLSDLIKPNEGRSRRSSSTYT
ncbi:MAG: hypothetical protein IH591_07195, partial [Bacteroidales bacterium]|nr:hypothetical protein [Bacteroidales bacterium]